MNNDSQSSLKKNLWEKMGKELESIGYPKNKISTKIQTTIEEKLEEKLGYPVKINNAHYYRIMAKHVWHNVEHSNSKKTTPPEGVKISSTTEYPEGTWYEIFELIRTVLKNNVATSEMIVEKLKFNRAGILKLKKSTVDADRNERLKHARKLIDSRRESVKIQIQKFYDTNDLEKVKTQLLKTIAEQEKLPMYFDDRMSITHFQKAMAKFAVDLGFYGNDIAKLLQITSKHMKINIYSNEAKQDNFLLLKWFDRCPDCGIQLSEFFESKISQFKKGTPIDYEDFEIDLLKPSSYQQEVIQLKKENFDLKQQVQELKQIAQV